MPDKSFTPAQRAAVCEALIEQAMQSMQLPRSVAILALSVRDRHLTLRGMPTQVEGVDFSIDFAHKMNHPDDVLHEDDVAKLVVYLEGVDITEAKRRVRERINDGTWSVVTKH
jgi:hypothetical protein